MKSPFPGMDPYLEAHWLDIQPRLIVESSNQLQKQLGDDLIARIEERVVVEDFWGSSRRIGPDVRVVEYGIPGEPVRPGGTAVAEPVVFTVESEPVTQRYIEILDLTLGGRVISVIEFLSASNKLPGDGREQYKTKQDDCRAAGVNLIEIDLTRAGRRELLVHRWAQARSTTPHIRYQFGGRRGRLVALYAIRFPAPLPTIRIPLRPTDADATLDLQSMIDAIYVGSRYDRTTDYRAEPVPALAPEDAVWADELLKAAGKR